MLSGRELKQLVSKSSNECHLKMATHKCRSESVAGHQEVTSNAKKSNKQKHNPTVQQKSSGKCACNTITQFVGEMYLPPLAVRKKKKKASQEKHYLYCKSKKLTTIIYQCFDKNGHQKMTSFNFFAALGRMW